MDEAVVAQWHVSPGSRVAAGEEMVDIETSKAANSVEAPVAGVVRKVVAGQGAIVGVGTILAVIADPALSDAAIDAYLAGQADAAPSTTTPPGACAQPPVDTVKYRLSGVHGPGLPVILLHGFGGSLESWFKNQDALAEGRVVYAVDLPGHGGSPHDAVSFDARGLAVPIKAFVDGLSARAFHIVGHSIGGLVARALARMCADRVASVTTLCTPGWDGRINRAFLGAFAAARQRREVADILRQLYHDPAFFSPAAAERLAQSLRIDGMRERLGRIAESIAGPEELAELAPGRAGDPWPTLAIFGDSDPVVPLPDLRGRADIAFEVFPGGGHMLHQEHAEILNLRLKAHFQHYG